MYSYLQIIIASHNYWLGVHSCLHHFCWQGSAVWSPLLFACVLHFSLSQSSSFTVLITVLDPLQASAKCRLKCGPDFFFWGGGGGGGHRANIQALQFAVPFPPHPLLLTFHPPAVHLLNFLFYHSASCEHFCAANVISGGQEACEVSLISIRFQL